MLIKELSRKAGVSVRSLRYYETKHLLISQRLENGYRTYDETAVERVKTIQLYLGLGLNTDEIAKVMDCPTVARKDRPLCKAAYELYQIKLKEVDQQIEILQNIRRQLKERISEWDKLY